MHGQLPAVQRNRPLANDLRSSHLARLACIYALKAGGVAERVLELTLGPVEERKCHVKFRGRRGRMYENAEPFVVVVEGDCSVE
jgi:hypothetical protein